MTDSLAQRLFGIDLWLVGAAHFVILFASFQVPYRLGWKQDLRQLMPFNRKLLWVQGGFTVLTIIAFGTLTLLLHTELLRGDRAALGLACFIGVYWTTRILVDAVYFSHADWPKGTAFVVGHALLTLLFFALAASYLGLFIWHLWLRPNRDVKWVGEEWALGSSLIGHLNYPIPIPFRYLLKDCIAPKLIRYLADSPELGFANERTIRLEQVSHETLIRVDAYTVGEPARQIPGGSLGFLKMLTEKWFFDFARFCDNDFLQSPNYKDVDSIPTRSKTRVICSYAAAAFRIALM